MTRVLVVGFTAEAADVTDSPLDVDDLRKTIAAGDAEVKDAGYELVRGWIGVDHDAGIADVEGLLSSSAFDVVMIGNGVRNPPQFTELFERLVNAVHKLAPNARFAFNADPPSTLAALQRNTN